MEKNLPMKFSLVLEQLKKRWFILGLILSVLVAAAYPELGKKKGILRTEYTVSIAGIALIFLLTGMSLKTKALKEALAYWQLTLLVQSLSLILIPAIGYGLAKLLILWGFDPFLASGLIIACSCPTTISSNVLMTKSAGGNEAASIVNAVLGSILGVFVSPPLIIWLLGLNQSQSIDLTGIFINLVITVIAPIIVGQICRYAFPKQIDVIQTKINFAIVNSVMLLILVWSVFCQTFAEKQVFEKIAASSLVAIIFIDLFLFLLFSLLAFMLSRVPLFAFTKPDSVAIVMCGATKTMALGIPLINLIFMADPAIGIYSIPLLIYHAEQLFVGAFFVTKFKSWIDPQQEPVPINSEDIEIPDLGAEAVETVLEPESSDASKVPVVIQVDSK